jgi:RNA polymerase sigma factor (sigma-70 family)
MKEGRPDMPSDINHIIQMSLNGDKNCQEILLQRLKPLIYKNIYMYWNPSDPITEDLAQEGYLLILESLQNYDEKYNVHFLQYIKIKIVFFYKNYYRNNRKHEFELSISDINIQNDEKNTIEQVIKDEEIKELLNNLKKLSTKEQEIIYLYYHRRLPVSEISEILNIPYRTVIGKKQVAIKKLRKFTVSGN